MSKKKPSAPNPDILAKISTVIRRAPMEKGKYTDTENLWLIAGLISLAGKDT
jgi:hypothetical protein